MHDQCALEFKRQLHQPGLVRRFLTRVLRVPHYLYSLISGLVARTH
jgi:hypothetical protein